MLHRLNSILIQIDRLDLMRSKLILRQIILHNAVKNVERSRLNLPKLKGLSDGFVRDVSLGVDLKDSSAVADKELVLVLNIKPNCEIERANFELIESPSHFSSNVNLELESKHRFKFSLIMSVFLKKFEKWSFYELVSNSLCFFKTFE